MNKLKTAIAMFDDARSVRSSLRNFNKATSDSSVDKSCFQFSTGGGNNDFASISLPVYLKAYTGRYGNSSCYTFSVSRDSEATRHAYISWMNKNKQLILDGIADELESSAKKMKDECRVEIEKAVLQFETAFPTDN